MCACSPLSRRRVQRFFAGMARVQEGKSRVRENRKKAWVTWRVGNKSEGNRTSLPGHIIKSPFLFSLHQLATVLLRHASHQSARFPLSPLRTRNAKCKKGTSEHGHCPRSKYKSAPKAPPRGVRTQANEHFFAGETGGSKKGNEASGHMACDARVFFSAFCGTKVLLQGCWTAGCAHVE